MKKIIALFMVLIVSSSFPGNAIYKNHGVEKNSIDYEPKFGIHSDGVELIEDFDSMDEFVEACYEKGYSIILS